ncbi:unnamed protein product [Adineta ricciae]|uniref:EGF-like domain-containing protein n=1 Tax=Adineta ricciae TaxID=249248 RepID=A0A814P5M8_ADIRI|nr:unnamed protein product [Adineta ricciae]CAF1101109.1 unnamed protein product [Adineta ricciae]
MITIEHHLLVLIFINYFLISSTNAARCYLCSEDTLRECIGNSQPDSYLYTNILQYYTEPCNGQCVLFRNVNGSIVRGCSWTYGHMIPKSIGWHEISPRIQAYFCDSHLCNNGTVEDSDSGNSRRGAINNPIVLSPHELNLLAANNQILIEKDAEQHPQVHQCYSCTARFEGCGEFIDSRYASNYIRPCSSSCIIFRNPNDLDLITRDCSTYWPQVRVKSGLQKLLGTDAFFCQESLCNGVSFDVIMGIFHNQLPSVITFPSMPITENIATYTTTEITTTLTIASSIKNTTVDIYNDNAIWDDPDLDYNLFEPVLSIVSLPNNHTTTTMADLSEEFDIMDEILLNSTSIDDLMNPESNITLNWWDFNDTLITVSPSNLTDDNDDDWMIFNTTVELPITRFDHLSSEDDDEDEDYQILDFDSHSDIDNMTLMLNTTTTTATTTHALDNLTEPLFIYDLKDHHMKDQLLEFFKPFPTLAIPPFSWMLSMINQTHSESLNSTTTTTSTTTTHTTMTTTTTTISRNTTTIFQAPFEYCKDRHCRHSGRLNSDCLCVCLPAFTGDECETVLCEQEPAHICTFVLEHECSTDYIRYLCPKFCQMNNCTSKVA